MTSKFEARTTHMRFIAILGTLFLSSTLTASALAQDASGSASLSLSSAGAQADAKGTAADSSSVPYLERYLPEDNLWELGLFGGLIFPSSDHNLIDSGRTHQAFDTAGEIGVRFAYYPLSFLGAELEAAGMPSGVDDGSDGGLFTGRGHLIAQLPIASITPFALAGAGALGGASSAMGVDVDPAIHFGLGAKAALDEYLSARLDLRDTLSQKFGESNGTLTHHPEVLVGLTFSLERKKPDTDGDGFADHRDNCRLVAGSEQGCPPDKDGDGVADDADQCKEVAGAVPTGCPDSDGDGLIDGEDGCPNLAAKTKTGCAETVCGDRDGDGFGDSVDKCPDDRGQAPDGCVNRDHDADGISDADDKCPTEAETKNGFKDKDGCPDEVPADVKKFSGIIRGIEFAYNSAEIAPASKPLLAEAARVLKQYDELKLEIAGHTDSQGSRELNLDLSKRRAESVKAYLVAQGVDAARLTTRGAGPDEPIADNATETGRQKNRRIEFRSASQ